MRSVGRALLVPVFVAGSALAQGTQDPTALVGDWQGVGRYLDAVQDREAGPLAFELSLDGSLSGRGRVGGAVLRDCHLVPGSQPPRLSARLEGAVRSKPARQKAHLLLLVTVVEVERFTAEFRLLASPGFDPAPCSGHVTFTRVRPLPGPTRPASPATGPSRP